MCESKIEYEEGMRDSAESKNAKMVVKGRLSGMYGEEKGEALENGGGGSNSSLDHRCLARWLVHTLLQVIRRHISPEFLGVPVERLLVVRRRNDLLHWLRGRRRRRRDLVKV